MTSISTSELPGIPPAAAIVVRTGGSSPKRPSKHLVHPGVVLQVVQIDVALQDLLHRRSGRLELLLDAVQHNLGVQLDVAFGTCAPTPAMNSRLPYATVLLNSGVLAGFLPSL